MDTFSTWDQVVSNERPQKLGVETSSMKKGTSFTLGSNFCVDLPQEKHIGRRIHHEIRSDYLHTVVDVVKRWSKWS